MKKVFDQGILQCCPTTDGILIAHSVSEDDGKLTVGFCRVVFKSGEFQPVQKSFFMMAKFGVHYKDIEGKTKNYITCKAHELDDGGIIVIDADGTGKKITADGEIEKEERIVYKGDTPSDFAVSGKSFWCSFKDDDSIVRFNVKTMREELRLGGIHSTFSKPEGIFADGNILYVCNAGSNKIWRVNADNYSVEEYIELPEPVHSYMQSGRYEFALLDSGLYLIENDDFK